MTRPRALLLDDQGELDRVTEALQRIGLDPDRRRGPQIVDGLPMPCELLITSGKRALDLPALSVEGPGGAPTWICVHTQDFHPLRERLRNLGVHYLVQATTDDRTLDLVLGQLLHAGSDRRRKPRLPVGCEIRWQWKARSDEKGQLLDLSEDGARILIDAELPTGAVVTLGLPAQLTAQPLELEAQVLRSERIYQAEGVKHAAVLIFEGLDPEARDVVDSLVRGERIGTRVTPLAPKYVDGDDIPDWEEMASTGDRRGDTRRVYEDHVDAFGPDDQPIGALGRDLSAGGLRLSPHPDLDLGDQDRVTLALHRSDSDEPLVLEATVLRTDADHSIVLGFGELNADQRACLDTMLEKLPSIAALDGLDERVFATEVLSSL